MRHLQRLLITVCALICPALAYGQGGVPASPIQFTSATGRPLAGATITFCQSTGTGFPCSPLASIFTNAALSTPSPNPVTTDGNGNIPVIFAAPGVYILSVTGSGITSTLVTATVAGSGGGNVVTTAVNNFTNTNNFAGPLNSTGGGSLAPGKFNGICIVDGVQNATLAAAVTCAGTSGVIEIPMFAVPTLTGNVTIPAGVTLRFDGPSGITTTGFTLTVNGPIVAPPNVQVFFGTGTVNLGSNALPAYCNWFPGTDIGAQCNAAYASYPSTGGLLRIAGGGSYTQTTGIAFSTLNKFASLECVGNTATGLLWTPASGTQLLLNWGAQNANPATQRVGWISGCTFLATTAANTAIGIDVNGPNGVSSVVIEKNAIMGHGTAPIQFTFSAPNPSFLMSIRENFIGSYTGTTPTSCIFINSAGENNRILTNTLSGCAHGILFGSNAVTGDFQIDYNSIDSNTIDMVNIPATSGPTLRVSLHNDHFEDNGSGSGIALQMAGGSVDIDTAVYIRDQASALTTAFNVTGGVFTYKDLTVLTNAVITNGILCTNSTCIGMTPRNVGGSGSVTNWSLSSGTGSVSELSPGCMRLQVGGAQQASICENGGQQIVTSVNGRSWIAQPIAGTFPDTPQTIASGTAAMTTALIATVACGTTVTVTATNVLATDSIDWSANAAVTAANNGLLILKAWPTAGNVNFNYCNPTAAGVTPTATTLNWSVRRP